MEVILSPLDAQGRISYLPLQPDEEGLMSFKADTVGNWNCTVKWEGNRDHQSVEAKIEFQVVPNAGILELDPIASPTKLGQEIVISGRLASPSDKAGEEIKIHGWRPDIRAWEQLLTEDNEYLKASTSTTGDFMVSFKPTTYGQWRFRAVWDGMKDNKGNVIYTRTFSMDSRADVIFPCGKIIIIIGGDPNTNEWRNKYLPLGNYVSQACKNRGFLDNDIRLITAKEHLSADRLKAEVLKTGLQIKSNENLYIYLLSDNLEGFILWKDKNWTERLEVEHVSQWLEELSDTNVVIIMEACYSGEFLKASLGKSLKAKPIIITSSDEDTQSIIYNSGDSFTERFFYRLSIRQNLKDSFIGARESMKLLFRNVPQVDSNGNGKPNETIGSREENYITDDYSGLSKLFLGNPDIVTLGGEPRIDDWNIIYYAGTNEIKITASISGGGVKATASILPENVKEFELGNIPEEVIELSGSENEGYFGSYKKLIESGTYIVIVHAENKDGIADPVMMIVGQLRWLHQNRISMILTRIM